LLCEPYKLSIDRLPAFIVVQKAYDHIQVNAFFDPQPSRFIRLTEFGFLALMPCIIRAMARVAHIQMGSSPRPSAYPFIPVSVTPWIK
jgi:hypothetical protein